MLSAIIHTKNSSRTLIKALESVQFADEIVVVDMESTDKCPQIAREHGATVYTHPDVSFVEPARNFGIEKAKGDWILILDADEYIQDSLKKKILQATQDEKAVYKIPRKNIIFNRWIQHTGWWPDFQVRLFGKGLVKWSNAIHSQPKIKETEKFFPAIEEYAIIHNNYSTVDSYIERLNKYTSIAAEQNIPLDSEIFTSATFYSTFSNEFIHRLFLRQGVEDGAHGLSLSLLQGIYKLVIQLKRWERTNFKIQDTDETELISELKKWQKELDYRITDWECRRAGGLKLFIWRSLHRLKGAPKI